MSKYRASLSTGTRSGGQSASAKHRYQNRQDIYLVGKSGVRDDLAASGSGNLPNFAKGDADVFWLATDSFERKNARLFIELQLNLPSELTLPQQIEAVKSYMSELCNKEKLTYSWVIHQPKNGENPHAHVMINEQKNDSIDRPAEQHFKRFNSKYPDRGGAQKTANLKPKQWLMDARASWAITANDALEKAGHKRHFDHRTLKEQRVSALLAKNWRKASKLDREVCEHEGWRVAALRRKHEAGEIDELPAFAKTVIEKNDTIKELNAANLKMIASMSDAELENWEREAYFDALAEREPKRFAAELEQLHDQALELDVLHDAHSEALELDALNDAHSEAIELDALHDERSEIIELEEVVRKIEKFDLSIKNQHEKQSYYSIKSDFIKEDYQNLKRKQNALNADEANQVMPLKILNKIFSIIGFKSESELLEPDLDRLSAEFSSAKNERELAKSELSILRNQRDALMQLDVSEPLRESERLRREAKILAGDMYIAAREALNAAAATLDKFCKYDAERDLQMIQQDLISRNNDYTIEDMQNVQQRAAEFVDAINAQVQKDMTRKQSTTQPTQTQTQKQTNNEPRMR